MKNRKINYDQVDKFFEITVTKSQIRGARKPEPINWCHARDVFTFQQLREPMWNNIKPRGYDPDDKKPTLYYINNSHSDPKYCPYCGGEIRKTGKRRKKYHPKCAKKVKKIQDEINKRKHRWTYNNIGTIPNNGYYFKKHLTRFSKNDTSHRIVLNKIKFDNHNDKRRSKGIKQIMEMEKRYCDECHQLLIKIDKINTYELVCSKCGLIHDF